jgi:hypothetical protein
MELASLDLAVAGMWEYIDGPDNNINLTAWQKAYHDSISQRTQTWYKNLSVRAEEPCPLKRGLPATRDGLDDDLQSLKHGHRSRYYILAQ